MKSILVHPPQNPIRAEIKLAASKSECNRALIIDALTGFQCQLSNISEARDSQTMQRLLKSDDAVADVIDAGTTMRFLTAYFTVTNQKKRMTGTPRMCERPIGILVDALKTLGADIQYENVPGYPPMQINGFEYSGNNELKIRGDVSSQYISALLLIAPSLPDGLTIILEGEVGSRPYIEMTLKQMEYFGIVYEADWEANIIKVKPSKYEPKSYAIESDWSGASYWYSIVALAEDAEVELLGLKENSLQGDSDIVNIMAHLGVQSTFTERGVLLTKIPAETSLAWDFTNCPDLAQTVAVCCAMKNIHLTLTGIESLKIKETDRVFALQEELKKLGAELNEVEKNLKYEVVKKSDFTATSVPSIFTYDDHRMALAFAPIGMIHDVIIEEPGVVVKSYPGYWNDLAKVTTWEELQLS
ncbi:3-phosphoshikimate 1-carboxyvinyltransferase [Dyadobacter subterraneus]|uniref:3-phosphoshikimate 1-carboxyvinyltransferase n=1 Tax=Dyadobacter subterraneus TaxID=2773304 RepID=A0ABR9W6N4_9BACT|nr:3-phosphoshikimate 1-carboxyvinyltransferase [Dyadobacter subterraneus]MBE9461126.1 3-phosphoshikimate 1-carboxyvinyltransferase [Dyadobacter subterraneus]